MKRSDLDRAFDPTPEVFSRRIDDTLRDLEEERPVKRFTIRTAIVAVLIALLLCGMAYAIIATQGLEWYYQNRFTAFEEHEPEKHQSIIEHLTTDVPQQESRDSQGLVGVTVQDYAWSEEQSIFTLSLAARATDEASYELYSVDMLDTDGATVGEIDPDDPESRMEHWLWTSKGFGLPKDVMRDPQKKLLMIEFGDMDMLIGDTGVSLPLSSYDVFTGEDGACIAVLNADLSDFDEDAVRERFAQAKPYPDVIPSDVERYETLRPGDSGDAVKRLQQRLSDLGYYNGHIDGVYGDEVSLCLASFQGRNWLANDGIAGPRTQARLYAEEAVTATGEEPEQFTQTLDEWTAAQQESFDWALDRAAAVSAAIAESTDADGMLSLTLPYQVRPFENGELGEPTDGVARFMVKIR